MDKNIAPYYQKQNYSNNPRYEPEETRENIGVEAGSISSDDSQRYEIDTHELIEQTYNSWLGRSLVNGVWEPDDNKKQMMSKELADKLKNSIFLKANTNTNLGIYTPELIKKIALETALIYNEALMFEAPRYNLSSHDFTILIHDIKIFLMQILTMALGGNMMEQRTRGRSINVTKVEQDGNIGGLR